jgi:hypothetical protein
MLQVTYCITNAVLNYRNACRKADRDPLDTPAEGVRIPLQDGTVIIVRKYDGRPNLIVATVL